MMKSRFQKLVLAFAGVLSLVAPNPGVRADTIAYAALSGSSGSVPDTAPFGVEDLATGTFVERGTIGASLGSNGALNGLGEIGGTLYGIGNTLSGHDDTLYKVNPANGNLAMVGSASVGFANFGSTTAGLFGLDYGMNLYSINPATGASTLIGPTGLPLFLHGDLSTGAGTLYLLAQDVDFAPTTGLYSLNRSSMRLRRVLYSFADG